MSRTAYTEPQCLYECDLYLYLYINISQPIIIFNLRTAAFKAYCAILVRRSNFRHQASPQLNPICLLLALLKAHHILHVSRIRVKAV